MSEISAHPVAKKIYLHKSKAPLLINAPSGLAETTGFFFAPYEEYPTDGSLYDFALIFVYNSAQLHELVPPVLPALGNEAKIWIAWPKKSSGIKSDLSRDSTWAVTYEFGLVPVSNISINETWSALRFKKSNGANAASENHNLFIDRNPAERPELIVPAEMQEILEAGGVNEKFNQLSYTHRKEYIEWVTGAKRPETKIKRLSELVAKVSLNKTEIGIYGNGKNYSLLSAVIISLHHISQYY